MTKPGVFCEVYGNTIKNRVIEYMLINGEVDFAASDIAEELGFSRPKAYDIIADFEKTGYIKKSRVIGRTQLYVMNKENPHMKLFMKSFNDCLKMVSEEFSEKTHRKEKAHGFTAGVSGAAAAQARHF